MQRIAFMMHILPGTEEEYERRHRQVWSDILVRQVDPATSFPPLLAEVFHLD